MPHDLEGDVYLEGQGQSGDCRSVLTYSGKAGYMTEPEEVLSILTKLP